MVAHKLVRSRPGIAVIPSDLGALPLGFSEIIADPA